MVLPRSSRPRDQRRTITRSMLAVPITRSAVLVSRLLDRRPRAKVAAVFTLLVGFVVAGSAGYVVQQGDTLSGIAARSNTSVRALVEANDISNADRIFVGQEITVPTPTAATSQSSPVESSHVVISGETVRGIAEAHGVQEDVVREANGIMGSEPIYTGTRLRLSISYPPFTPGEADVLQTYVVRVNDTLGGIAARFGTTAKGLARANSLVDPNMIRVGESLVVSDAGWMCPVPGASFFNDWAFPRSGGRVHEGNDLFAPKGTPVIAPVSGYVHQTVGTIGGLQFTLEGDDGATYIGSHMDSFGASGRVGAGDVVGTTGDSGNAKGSRAHIHFEIHPFGQTPMNPYPTLVGACR